MVTPSAPALHPAALQARDAGPARIGDYEILLAIGSGGMGNVYLVRKNIVGDVYREFAIKLIRPELDATSDWSQVLVEEAKIAARIRHPNVVSVVEVGSGPWGVYLVMEYVEGVTLHRLSRLAAKGGGNVPLRITARVLHDALAGLHAVHELVDANGEPLNIVHRDVSPHNLLVGVDGATRLTDFGIAKARSRPDTTETGAIKGKLRYMAPEQALGKPLDRRTDVWAAGVVAWEAIAGERLFSGDTDTQTLLRIVTKPEVPPLCERRPDIPAEVDDVVASALQYERERRTATALELRTRFEAAWRAADGIADPHEVAEYITDIASQDLMERRERARQAAHAPARAAVAEVAAPSNSGSRPLAEAPRRGANAPPVATDDTKTVNVVDAERPRAATRRTPLILATVAVAVAAGVVYRSGALRSPEQASPAPTGIAAAESAPVATETATAAATAPTTSASTPSASGPRLVDVRADVPLRAVEVDGREVVLSRPNKTVSVQLSSNDGKPVHIVAVAADGRRAEEAVNGDLREVAFTFGASTPKPTPARPASDKKLLPYRPSVEGRP